MSGFSNDPDRPVALVTAPMRGDGLDLLREHCDVHLDPWIDHDPIRLWNDAQLAAEIDRTGATVLICEADQVGPAVCERPLRVIGSTRGDPTNVDIPAATAAGVPVLGAPGRNADGVAELAVGLLFAVTRHLIRADRDVREGEIYRGGSIPYQRFRAWQFAGRTVGIVGYGAVGRAAAWRFAGLGMEVLSYDPFADDATHRDLGEMLPRCDVVSMHAAVTPDTTGMMGAAQFAAMPDGGVYLNTARAALHDMDALVGALASGHLGGAGLDHFQGEFLAPDHPIVGMDNVVLAPHIGGATYDTEANHTRMIASDVVAVLEGRTPAHCVNPEVLS